MSRAFRFRIWDNRLKCFWDTLEGATRHGLIITSDGTPGIVSDVFDRFAPEKTINYFETTALVIEQFTGLIDSKGREIYEGDIVEPDYFYSGQPDKRWPNLVVEYSDQMGAFFLNEYWETKLGRLRSANGSHIIHGGPAISRGRVVGHIHQVEPITP